MEITVAVVDPNLRQRNETIIMLDEYINRRHLDMRPQSFRSGPEMFMAIERQGLFDLYILETKMADMNGIVIARELRARSNRGKIVYYTADSTYAVQAFEVRASDYLLKPATRDKFTQMLDYVMESIEYEDEMTMIEIKSRNGYVRVASTDITFVNIVNRSLCYHFRDGTTIRTVTIRGTFRQAVQPLLEQPSFVLAGASMLINRTYVRVVGRDSILLSNGERVTPPRSAFNCLREL